MKMADSYFAVPNNQYFLTSSADGIYISPDFYLRLAGRATEVLKGAQPLTTNVTIPYSVAPLWFRTSVEPGYDATLSWTDSPDPGSVPTNVGNPQCGIVSGETRRTGNASIRVAGNDNAGRGGSYHYFRAFDVDIPVKRNTRLSFWTYPVNKLSRYVSVDLVMTDGSTLRGSDAIDLNCVPMHPRTGRGTVNTWQQTVCYIGNWLNGKTIDRILIAYDHPADTGSFRTYIDDIVIRDTVQVKGAQQAAPYLDYDVKEQAAQPVSIFPQPVSHTATLRFGKGWTGMTAITLLSSTGEQLERKMVNIDGNQISLPVSHLPGGIYFVRISNGKQVVTKKLVVMRE